MASDDKNMTGCAAALTHLRAAEKLLSGTDAKDAKKRLGWAIGSTEGYLRHTQRRKEKKETTNAVL